MAVAPFDLQIEWKEIGALQQEIEEVAYRVKPAMKAGFEAMGEVIAARAREIAPRDVDGVRSPASRAIGPLHVNTRFKATPEYVDIIAPFYARISGDGYIQKAAEQVEKEAVSAFGEAAVDKLGFFTERRWGTTDREKILEAEPASFKRQVEITAVQSIILGTAIRWSRGNIAGLKFWGNVRRAVQRSPLRLQVQRNASMYVHPTRQAMSGRFLRDWGFKKRIGQASPAARRNFPWWSATQLENAGPMWRQYVPGAIMASRAMTTYRRAMLSPGSFKRLLRPQVEAMRRLSRMPNAAGQSAATRHAASWRLKMRGMERYYDKDGLPQIAATGWRKKLTSKAMRETQAFEDEIMGLPALGMRSEHMVKTRWGGFASRFGLDVQPFNDPIFMQNRDVGSGLRGWMSDAKAGWRNYKEGRRQKGLPLFFRRDLDTWDDDRMWGLEFPVVLSHGRWNVVTLSGRVSRASKAPFSWDQRATAAKTVAAKNKWFTVKRAARESGEGRRPWAWNRNVADIDKIMDTATHADADKYLAGAVTRLRDAAEKAGDDDDLWAMLRAHEAAGPGRTGQLIRKVGQRLGREQAGLKDRKDDLLSLVGASKDTIGKGWVKGIREKVEFELPFALRNPGTYTVRFARRPLPHGLDSAVTKYGKSAILVDQRPPPLTLHEVVKKLTPRRYGKHMDDLLARVPGKVAKPLKLQPAESPPVLLDWLGGERVSVRVLKKFRDKGVQLSDRALAKTPLDRDLSVGRAVSWVHQQRAAKAKSVHTVRRQAQAAARASAIARGSQGPRHERLS